MHSSEPFAMVCQEDKHLADRYRRGFGRSLHGAPLFLNDADSDGFFAALQAGREVIERELGGPLIWHCRAGVC